MLAERTCLGAAIAVAMLLLLPACDGTHGRPISAWTLDATQGPHDVPVTLPLNLLRKLPNRETPFSLRAVVPLSSGERSRPLTLVFGCYHAPLLVAVNGIALDDDGDSGMGEHRFVIPETLTARQALDIVATSQVNVYTVITGFGTTPELMVGVDRHSSGIVMFMRVTVVLAFVLGCVLSLMFGVMYLLDRRLRENAALAVVGLAIIPYGAAWLGVLSIAHPWVRVALSIQLGVSQVAFLAYFYLVFELGRLQRAWIGVICGLALVESVSVFWFPLKGILTLGKPLELVALCGFLVWRILQQAWRGRHRGDARILLGGGIIASGFVTLEGAQNFTGRWYGGLHTIQLAIIVVYASLAVVLARQHVARERTLETTTAALRHQVAARSSELSDALLQLQAQPAVILDRVVDQRYRIIRELGAGGMGAVYEAERLTDHHHVALKTLRRSCAPAAMARFAREAQIAASVEHPNLVPVLDVGLSEGLLFLVMPLVRGGSLAAHRSRYGDATWATPILRQIASGLAALHARGIVHRDLKPANVLVDDGAARIADFGLSSLSADDSSRRDPVLTRSGAVFGTPQYMAPELAGGVHEANSASDMFAFGVLAYELLTATQAFTEPPVLARVGGRPIAPPARNALPEPLFALVASCLALDPDQRPAAAAIAAALS